jgi:hypothetical protein
LIQGGTISRGRLRTVSVEGSYWMIWQTVILGDYLARRNGDVLSDSLNFDASD